MFSIRFQFHPEIEVSPLIIGADVMAGIMPNVKLSYLHWRWTLKDREKLKKEQNN